jgi:hypothetical protein
MSATTVERAQTYRISGYTDSLQSPRNVTINNATSKLPNRFSILSPTLPYTLKPGECIDFDRFDLKYFRMILLPISLILLLSHQRIDVLRVL